MEVKTKNNVPKVLSKEFMEKLGKLNGEHLTEADLEKANRIHKERLEVAGKPL